MQLTENIKETAGWTQLIRDHRRDLGLAMEAYGSRYGVHRAAVWNWEHGLTEASYQVTWDVMAWVLEGLGE